jgi:hypothetical protein
MLGSRAFGDFFDVAGDVLGQSSGDRHGCHTNLFASARFKPFGQTGYWRDYLRYIGVEGHLDRLLPHP